MTRETIMEWLEHDHTRTVVGFVEAHDMPYSDIPKVWMIINESK